MAIEVRISATPSGGLRVIPEIPPTRPCKLEGQNGIGKSVAIRLLVLASGGQPYENDQNAWRSLRDCIGEAEITIAGLRGSLTRVALRLTPDRWPDTPVPEVADWLGTATVDGQPIDLSALFAMFDVAHLSGTERLTETIERRRGAFSSALATVIRNLRGIEDAQAEMSELADELAFLAPARAAADLDLQRGISGSLGNARNELAQLRDGRGKLQTAVALMALLRGGAADERREKLEEARSEFADARSTLEGAERVLKDAVKELSKGSSDQKETAKLERQLAKLHTRLEEIRSQGSALLQSLDFPRQDAFVSEDGLTGLPTELTARLGRATSVLLPLEEDAYRQSLGAAERAVHDELRLILDDAVEAGHGGFVIARIYDRDLTVDELATALTAPRPVQPPDDSDLAEARRRVGDLEALLLLSNEFPVVQDQITALAERIAQRGRGTEDPGALEIAAAQAREHRDECATRSQRAAMALGALQASGAAALGVADAEQRLRELLGELSLTEDDLGDAHTEAMLQVTDKERELEDLQNRFRAFDESSARRRARRKTLANQMLRDAGFEWLAVLGGVLGEPEIDDAAWQRLSDKLSHVTDAAHTLRDSVLGLEAAAASDVWTGTSAFALAVRNLVEQDAVADLADPAIGEALFDGGTVTGINVADGSVTWRMPSHEIRTRPLSAFSSGEQALGYVRARLRQIAATPRPNRMIFLDEFGAFIAADRRRPLAELLSSRELSQLADQTIVVLPLQADYEAELEQTTGQLHHLYAKRVSDIEERGYFTEAFEA
jgi:hypothetical protein